MIYYKKQSFFSIVDVFYDHTEKPNEKVDVLSYYFVKEKPLKAFSLQKGFTMVLDLTKDEEDLFSLIGKTNRYQINRAKMKDGIICINMLEPGETNISAVNDFINFYNTFALSKNLPSITIKNIEQYITMKNLCIRAAKKDDEIVAMHLYDYTGTLARLFYSCSLFRNNNDSDYKSLLGRANRFLHWDDIVYFKQKGLLIYDFCGWYGGKTDKEKLKINEFKESFNGQIKEEYSYVVPITFKGYIWIFIRSLKYLINKIKYWISR